MRTPHQPRPAVPLLAAVALLATLVPAASLLARGQADARERILYVSALDEDGEPVDVLEPGDVVVREDGVRREVLRVSRAVEPMDIAVLVDNSQAAREAIVPLREGLRAFVQRMANGNNVALFGLAARPTIIVDYTMDAARLEQGAGRLFPMLDTGMTLLDALTEVSSGLARREGERAVIVAVITDGIEFTNRYSRDVIETMQRASVAFHAVTIGTFPALADVERERALVLDRGTRETGGRRVTLLAPTAVGNALDQLARELSSQHKVVYARPQSLIPPEEVEVDSARAGLTVRGTPARGQGV